MTSAINVSDGNLNLIIMIIITTIMIIIKITLILITIIIIKSMIMSITAVMSANVMWQNSKKNVA